MLYIKLFNVGGQRRSAGGDKIGSLCSQSDHFGK